MKKLLQLKFLFKAKALEVEFIKIRRPLFQRSFVLNIILVSLMLVFVLTKSQGQLTWLGVTSVCVPSVLLLICTVILKNLGSLEILVIFLFLPIYGGLLYLRCRIASSMEDISSGYFFGFIERMIIERLPLFRHKALLGILSGVLRLIIINKQDVYSFLLEALIPLLGLLLDFTKEKNERKIFKSFYDSREFLIKFKELLKFHLKENILVIKENLQESLFMNDPFQNNFVVKTLPSPPEFLKHFTFEKESQVQAIKILREAQISFEKDLSLRQSSREIKDDGVIHTERNQIITDLYCFLEAVQKIENHIPGPFEYIFNQLCSETPEDSKLYKIKVCPFYWEGQKALALIIKDITEQYTIMNLKAADENKDRVVATISHELRTPLNAILGMIQLMEKETTLPHFARYLKICGNSSKLLLSLINSILDMGQIKNNKLKLYPGKYKLKDVMNDIISLFEFQCQQKQLYLQLKVGKELPSYICTDKNRLAQIIINLVGNALKFTFQGGITILVSQDPNNSDSIKFSVADTGVGIKEQEKNKLFQMYGKLEGSSNMNTQGIGLGLHISNTLAKLLSEDSEEPGISVESEYGKGSTFTFKLKKNLYNMENSLSKDDAKTLFNKESVLSELSQKRVNRDEEVQSLAENDLDPILSFDETDEDKDFNEERAQEGILGLSGKILKYHTLVNSSQLNLETSRLSRNFIGNQRDASVTIGNLDQTYASPRMHLLSYASPFVRYCRRRLTFTNNSINILVADDNAFNLMVAKELIEAQGICAHTALNGQLAIDQIIKKNQEKQPYKLILMDCEMPVMNGFEASKLLTRKMNKGELPKIPIIAVTANSIETTKEECLRAGMIDCLGKPLIESELKQIIVKYILRENDREDQ